jgi:hypothetical protein
MNDDDQSASGQVQIGFRGSVSYRLALQKEALNRGMKVQQLIENAVEAYLEQSARQSKTDPVSPDTPGKESPAPGPYPHKRGTEGSTSTVLTLPKGTEPTEREMPWLWRALKVLRSKKPGLPSALKCNLIQFEDSADQWDESNRAAGSSGGGSASEQFRSGDVDAQIASLTELARDITDELAQMCADDKARRKGKGSAARKTS